MSVLNFTKPVYTLREISTTEGIYEDVGPSVRSTLLGSGTFLWCCTNEVRVLKTVYLRRKGGGF